jgi:hypothetical protein
MTHAQSERVEGESEEGGAGGVWLPAIASPTCELERARSGTWHTITSDHGA